MEVNMLPRRARLDQMTPAEKAIIDAVLAVEALPADARLTEAVVLLQAARDTVADYVEGVRNTRRYVEEVPVVGCEVTTVQSTATDMVGPVR